MNIDYFDPRKKDWFLISWNITNKCNYRCSYCPSQLHDGSSGWPDFEKFKKFVENFRPLGKELCYRITGGEPTYWKKFIDFAQVVKSQGHTFSFLTNGSQSLDYYKNISKYTDGMILSYHPQYSNLKHFSDIANSTDIPVIINLVMVPEKFEELLTIANSIYNATGENLSIWPKVIVDKTSGVDEITNNTIHYTEEQRIIIKNWPFFRKINDTKLHRGDITYNGKKITANDLLLADLNEHAGWKCWAGVHMLSIDNDTKIYRADCRQGGSIGTIDNYTPVEKPLICTKPKCSCLSDIYLKKVL